MYSRVCVAPPLIHAHSNDTQVTGIQRAYTIRLSSASLLTVLLAQSTRLVCVLSLIDESVQEIREYIYIYILLFILALSLTDTVNLPPRD